MANQVAKQEAISATRLVLTTIKSGPIQKQIREALPPGVNIDRFTRVTLAAIQHRPELLDADRESLYSACVRAAQDGLLPDGRQGIINIYNTNLAPKGQPAKWVKKCQFQPMVEGIIYQFAKAGINAYAVSVYANDKIEIWNDDTGQHIKHVPMLLGDRGDRVAAVAVGTSKGLTTVELMTREDLAKARAASKSPDFGPWKDWTDRMEQKSALHRLRKRIAIVDEAAAEALDRLDEEFEEEPDVEVAQVATEARRPRAMDKVTEQRPATVDEHGEIVLTQDGDPGAGAGPDAF